MEPMATTGQEAVGSMGNDAPISALSDKPKPLYTYFKQNFAQVTNPPIDPIREELVMSLVSFIGPRPNLFDLEGLSRHKRLEVRQPILTNDDLEKIRSIGHVEEQFDTKTLDFTYPAEKGAAGMKDALDRLCERAEAAVHGGYNIIILSDRQAGPERIAIPALLATAAVHHHLIRKGLRTSVGLVVETGEAREVHHFCCLAGYGAEAINPYLAFETLIAMKDEFPEKIDDKEVVKRYIKSIDKGILKVMSKMGISTYQSYCGAQIFDAVGLRKDFVDQYFFGTATTIEGVGLGRDRRGDGAPPSRGVRRLAGAAPRARSRRRIPVPRARRGPCLVARIGRDPAARGARQLRYDKYRAFAADRERAGETVPDHPRPVPHQERRTRTGASRCRSRRSSPPRRSSSASPPARCRTARSRARRTPRSPSP